MDVVDGCFDYCGQVVHCHGYCLGGGVGGGGGGEVGHPNYNLCNLSSL
jgi:hypothetical protein